MVTQPKSATSPLFVKRYEVHDLIGRGGMGAVYRATDRLTGQIVALKRVYWTGLNWHPHFSTSRPADGLEVTLAHEFQTLASLRHPNIISVLDYGFDMDRQPYFTMDFLPNALPITDAARNQSPDFQVDLFIQLLRALDYLHRRQVIHCDLKPSNVLVVSGQVKVLDFGLATPLGQSTETSGSLLYMAPETLESGVVGIPSDLYSAGVIAYEMLTGHLPFSDGEMEALMNAIQHIEPDLTSTGIYAAVLRRLLNKTPEQRYGSAREVIADVGQLLRIPPPIETQAVRESFLQAAQFVGRDAELSQLQALLQAAVSGNGSAWLIAGESGVGKSRLLDELHICSLVDGVLVVRGQAISEGSNPYHMWRSVLRWLCLLTELTDFEAGVFKTLINDIEFFVRRPIPDLPETDAKTLQDQFFRVLANVFRRQRFPIAIFFEDIHWADDESISTLARLSDYISKFPILILASYRNDEIPNLPQRLSRMYHLTLQRLNEGAIGELAGSMMGVVSLETAITRFLYQETEGNTFFLVEVMRALTEEVGRTDAIEGLKLQQHVLTGGIHSFVQRHLNRVLPKYQPLLRLAAVAGRQIDVAVLLRLEPTLDLFDWLDNCTNVAVLEIRDGNWRFAHDRLRDGLLQELSIFERRQLHRAVAVAIETLYAGTPDYAATLAYQWGEAGNIDKQIHYLVQSGKEARRSGANRTALEALNKAALLTQHGFKDMLAEIEQLRGETLLALGNLGESALHMHTALRLMNSPVPTRLLHAAVIHQVLIQIVHRLIPYISTSRAIESTTKYLKIAEVYDHLTLYNYFMGHPLPALHSALSALNFAERAKVASPVLSNAYSSMAVAAGVFMLHKLAEFYFRRSEAVARSLNQPRLQANILQHRGVYSAGRGNWHNAESEFLEGRRIARSVGDERLWRELAVADVFQLYYQGRLTESAALVDEIRASAERDEDQQSLLYCASFGSATLIRLGNNAEAIRLLTEYKDLNSTVVPSAERGRILNIYGLLSQAYFSMGQIEKAREAVETATNTLTSGAKLDAVFPLLFGYTACLETCLGLREISQSGDEALRSLDRIALTAFRNFAQRFEVGRPGYYRLRGLTEWLDGKQKAARNSWLTGLTWARRLSTPLEEAFVLCEIGRHATVETERSEYLTQGFALFDKLVVPHYKEHYGASLNVLGTKEEDAARAGARIYSDFTLHFYDFVVLGLSNRLIWRCPSQRILNFYNEHISANHLDVGVGTGYFLDKCKFPSEHPSVALMDLNPTSLKVTASRLSRFSPMTYIANVLNPLHNISATYDSIGISYLLHCLPGTMKDKAAVFRNLKPLLNSEGVLFGTTILGKDINCGLPARLLMSFYNKTATFNNTSDNIVELENILRDNFGSYSVKIEGCVAFFIGKV